MDLWEWLALAASPLWLGAFTILLRMIMNWSTKGSNWWGLPVWMGVGLPIAALMVSGPTYMIWRYSDRSIAYDNCVPDGAWSEIERSMNRCPQWTILAAAHRGNER